VILSGIAITLQHPRQGVKETRRGAAMNRVKKSASASRLALGRGILQSCSAVICLNARDYSADGAGRHAQHFGTLRLALAAGEQFPQPGKGFLIKLPRPAPLPTPGPDLSPAVSLGSCEAPIRAISATVIGFSPMRRSVHRKNMSVKP